MLEFLPHLDRSLLASVLGISRRYLYKKDFIQANKDKLLKEQIEEIWSSHPSKASYGYRRMAIELGMGKKTDSQMHEEVWLEAI